MSGNLFKKKPIIPFVPTLQLCRNCDNRLRLRRTETRTIYTLAIGIFEAHIRQKYCQFCGAVYSCEALSQMVPSHCCVGFDVLDYVGRALFVECLNEAEIQRRLQAKNISISRRAIGYLGKKFVLYLAIAHRECCHELKQFLSVKGGYILHLDGTVEGESPHLVTSLDELSGIVLHNMKVPSENTEDIVTFLREIKKLYGLPLACVHDMGQGICAAIAIVFPGVLDFICHFHFLRDLGKDLFEKEHANIRRWLQSYRAKTIFRSAQKELFQIINQRLEFQKEIAHYMAHHQQGVPKASLSAVVKTYLMVAWMLAFKRELKGLGFPFDRQHWLFYQRIKIVIPLAESLKKHLPKKSAFTQMMRIFSSISRDSELHNVARQVEEKSAVFDQLRERMRIALPQTDQGLNDRGDETINLREIEQKVKEFRQSKEVIAFTEKDKGYQKMAQQMDKYWDKLFIDPIEVKTPHGKQWIQPQRTNNAMEQFFREEKRKGRKRSGTSSLTKSFKAMVADTPLIRNLNNPQYMNILLKGKSSLVERFAQIDAALVRQEMEKHQEEWRDLPKGLKNILKIPDLPQKLFQSLNGLSDN